MKVNSDIEASYCKTVSLEHRKKFAQFFTPYAVADIMTEWLLHAQNMHTVLEPAFGLGIFSRILLSKKNNLDIKGFDIDDTILNEARKDFSNYENVQLLLQDYMFNDWDNKYDGIICNPPYFKFHDYDNKSILKEIEQRLSCKLSGFTNLYTLFLLKSIHQLKPGGRCIYIVPSEFMNSDYGKLVKQHLIKTQTLRHIIVFDFEENVFDDALTTSCIILCANDDKTDYVRFTNIKHRDDLSEINKLIDLYPASAETSISHTLNSINPEVKWKSYYQTQSAHQYSNLVPFQKYAKVVRGIATGANDYFTFNLSKAETYHIDTKYLLPCICKCNDVSGQSFYQKDFETLRQNDKKVFLFNAENTDNEDVKHYLAKGVEEGINKKYLTSSRKPWYALEKRPPSPIWVSVFNRNGLRFIRNYACVSNLTTFHCVYPQKNLFSDISTDLLFAYLLTDTSKRIFEDNAREYGNGLQKFEPNDLNKGMMLDLGLLSDKDKKSIEDLYLQYLKNNSSSELLEIDNILSAFFAIK